MNNEILSRSGLNQNSKQKGILNSISSRTAGTDDGKSLKSQQQYIEKVAKETSYDTKHRSIVEKDSKKHLGSSGLRSYLENPSNSHTLSYHHGLHSPSNQASKSKSKEKKSSTITKENTQTITKTIGEKSLNKSGSSNPFYTSDRKYALLHSNNHISQNESQISGKNCRDLIRGLKKSNLVSKNITKGEKTNIITPINDSQAKSTDKTVDKTGKNTKSNE